MTRLAARLKDFELALDTEGHDKAYRFRFGACDDFNETLDAFKAGLDRHLRRPMPDRQWLWEVDAMPATRRVLAGLFENFEAEYETAASQLRMFGA